jgi:ATP synthase protein I
MSELPEPKSGEDFDRRLHRAREANAPREERSAHALPKSGIGLATRVGTELVVAVVVGAFIGYWLDRWLGTQPWLLIAFTLFGGAAGMLNVFRLATGQGYGVGYRAEGEDEQKRGD